MLRKLYVIYDKKVECYRNLMVFANKAEAIREWGVVVNEPNTQFNRHPGDFALIELGEIDEQQGSVTGYDKIHCATGLDLLKVPVDTLPMFPHAVNQ